MDGSVCIPDNDSTNVTSRRKKFRNSSIAAYFGTRRLARCIFSCKVSNGGQAKFGCTDSGLRMALFVRHISQ